MVTLKLKKPAVGAKTTATEPRAPVRGGGGARRPTLAQAQAQRSEREARYQEQLRLRYGDRPPAPRRDEPPRGRPRPQPNPDAVDPRTLAPDDLRHRLMAMPKPAPAHEPARRPDRPRPDTPPRPAGRRDARAAPFPDARGTAGPGSRPGPRSGPPNDPRRDPRHDPRHDPRAGGPRRDTWRPSRDDDDDGPADAPHAPGSLRLSKRMSELGIASRREADEWIAKGWVRVDDQVVSELGSRVMPGQRITVDSKAKFQQAQRVTVLINKPVGYVSGQAEDGYEPAFVLVQPQNQWRDDHSGTRFLQSHLRSLVPAGRLDIDSVGLLVLTQDGRIAKQLVGEDSEVEKEYLVRVEAPAGGALSDSGLALLRHGLELDGVALRPAEVEWLNEDQLRFVLREGRKRQIRRMCEAVGLKVVGLKRVRVGKVMLGDLPTGQWRYLRADESFV
jgi:23S rRNA pseudouridine2604 synthase